MTSDEGQASSGTAGRAGLPFDTSKAHHARVYDYMLGGKDNYAADRAAADALLAIAPGLGSTARANRAFLQRVIRYLTEEAGMRQFLDIGTGIPTAGNTHQVAQAVAPETRVVYVDYDPIVLAHARALLTSSETGATDYIHADLRDIDTIISRARQLLDFTRPVGVTMLAILHAIPDSDDPHAIVARVMDAVPAGSYLAISHVGSDLLDGETLRSLQEVLSRTSQQQYTYRSQAQVARFFEGMDLVEPGLVQVGHWRPEPGTADPGKSTGWCAVGRKR